MSHSRLADHSHSWLSIKLTSIFITFTVLASLFNVQTKKTHHIGTFRPIDWAHNHFYLSLTKSI